jgi:hypothetical protein
MKWLINYIRQCFCRHDFVIDEQTAMRGDVDTWSYFYDT